MTLAQEKNLKLKILCLTSFHVAKMTYVRTLCKDAR